MSELSPKHQQFINEYLRLWNATEAYMLVYPDSSYEAARRDASRLLTNADIAAEIKRRIAETVMSADEVLLRMAEQARASYSAYIRKGGTVDIVRMVADGKAHLIKSIKHGAKGKDIEFYDAFAALQLLGKHHDLFVDKLQIKLEKELEKMLDTLEQKLDEDTYKQVLAALSSTEPQAQSDPT